MLNFVNLLADGVFGNFAYNVRLVLCILLIIAMAFISITAIVLILLQPANSSGIDALGGSSETFFGKNKGKSIEAKMKKWTWICLAVLLVLSVGFYILQLPIIWA